jgi:type VI secretion system secreted protein Hcp
MKLNPTLSKTLALVAPVTILTVSNTFGASDYYLKIDGIKGESVNEKHKDWIEISSFSWGLSQTSAVGGGGAGTGKVSLQDFHFTMNSSKASPKLMLACATGQRIPSLQFVVARPDDATGAGVDYYVVTLSDVLVSSYQSSGGPPPAGSPTTQSPPVTESVSFNYTKIEWTYVPATDDGTGPVTVAFDGSTLTN